jgi:hypothetical protein
MTYYAYLGKAELGKEPCGMMAPLPPNGPKSGISKLIFSLKTDAGAIRRCRRTFGEFPFRLYKYHDADRYHLDRYKEVKT